jgi:threonine/homoserine/homoserine lactone efflux protein
MKTSSRIFMWGMMISFLGALPPGIMNLAAIQIESREGATAAMVYAFGSMFAEVLIVRVTLSCMSWLCSMFYYSKVNERIPGCIAWPGAAGLCYWYTFKRH